MCRPQNSTASRQETHRVLHDWLRVEFAIEKPTNKLQNLTALDSDAFVNEVKNIRGRKLPLTAAGLQTQRQEYTRTIEPARHLSTEALGLERTLAHLVNQAYALTPEETALLWSTAPPRMPISPPLAKPAPQPAGSASRTEDYPRNIHS